jgi:hypothetical protein
MQSTMLEFGRVYSTVASIQEISAGTCRTTTVLNRLHQVSLRLSTAREAAKHNCDKVLQLSATICHLSAISMFLADPEL